MNADPPIASVVAVDKPYGATTMAACRAVKRAIIAGGLPKSVKVGHAGTLDPLATGLVLVLVGRATRLSDALMAAGKRYTAEVDLSRRSTTEDLEGQITVVDAPRWPTPEELAGAVARFVGRIQQRPPDHSAVRVGGRKAYDLARAGTSPTIAHKEVLVHSLTITAYNPPLVTLDIACGKGFYVRSLARDLGEALGLGGMLTALRRTRVGPFDVASAARLWDLPAVLTRETLPPMPMGMGPAAPRTPTVAGASVPAAHALTEPPPATP